MDNRLETIKEELIDEVAKNKVSNLFKAIGDPTRITILFALKNGELSVSELTTVVEMTQSAISHQLRVLRDANLVVYRREGKEVYYRLADNHVHVIFNQALEHIMED
ncbi:MAG: metalloregulator ArsR/SmtB family transcription factor [Acholeplasma sp.]|nr:metalloregulator ArsR/SmtB family transcription factor [Acholeplasma sp.]